MSTVAVIIPVRNKAGTLERAVVSAAAADEIHVVDDASTDNIGEVVARLPVKVTYWRWPMKSLDHTAALRTVYHASRCRQFIGMGADDFLLPTLIPAIRENADAPVIFSDYAVVDINEKVLAVIPQDAREKTALGPEEVRARFQSTRNATETGIGSSLRCDVAAWLWARGWEALGPHVDSIGYSAAAATFGCVLLPFVGAAYTHGGSSYGRESLASMEDVARLAGVCLDWLDDVGIDEATAHSLCEKRCTHRYGA
jgi:hypothetical protein